LPLNGKSLENKNSAFINAESFEPHVNQLEFLTSIQRLTIDKLEEIYSKFFGLSNLEILKIR